MFKKIIWFILLTILPAPVLASEIIPKIDFVDASAVDIVSSLAKKEKINLIISGDQAGILSKKTTVHLENISARDAIKEVLSNSGLDYSLSQDVLFVADGAAGAEKIRPVALNHLQAANAAKLLKEVMPQIKVADGSRSNSLVIRGKLKEVAEAEQLLQELDRPSAQILIESKVVEISKSDSVKFGLSHGDPAGTFNFITSKETKKPALASDIPSVLNALLAEGKANVIANPRIATLDNREALINIGSRIPYAIPVNTSSTNTQWSVEYIDAGIKLKITPHLGAGEIITAAIEPEVSSISEWRTTPAGDFPVISTRNASAVLRVKNGETIVIGGLISEAERENIARIPIIGHIPIAGLLFQNRTTQKEKTEIVFLITPHLI